MRGSGGELPLRGEDDPAGAGAAEPYRGRRPVAPPEAPPEERNARLAAVFLRGAPPAKPEGVHAPARVRDGVEVPPPGADVVRAVLVEVHLREAVFEVDVLDRLERARGEPPVRARAPREVARARGVRLQVHVGVRVGTRVIDRARARAHLGRTGVARDDELPPAMGDGPEAVRAVDDERLGRRGGGRGAGLGRHDGRYLGGPVARRDAGQRIGRPPDELRASAPRDADDLELALDPPEAYEVRLVRALEEQPELRTRAPPLGVGAFGLGDGGGLGGDLDPQAVSTGRAGGEDAIVIPAIEGEGPLGPAGHRVAAGDRPYDDRRHERRSERPAERGRAHQVLSPRE